ncbi:hypothetical protein F0562_005982 [Nyssa sinensis]|uniref:Uncharacterized protein n=1 Tax=Nyssa sinensis TaxID=561372 RepID=A0A5J5AJS0_9ASTE|nr:hypothetical protein F0562_005982 [Nyssa sinensis]
MDKEAEQVRESKAESESRIHELEKKIMALEARGSIQNSQRIKVEGESKAIIDKKDSEVRRLKKCIEELDSVVLKNSVRNVKETEHKMGQLHKELEASEQMISGLKEKVAEVVNGEALVMDRVISKDREKGLMGLKLQWPVVAASVGAIATVAVVGYFHYESQL